MLLLSGCFVLVFCVVNVLLLGILTCFLVFAVLGCLGLFDFVFFCVCDLCGFGLDLRLTFYFG